MKLQALNYNVFVTKEESKHIVEGGIDITSETDKNEKYRKGKIVSFGSLCPKVAVFKIFGFDIPFIKKDTIRIGQEVIYDRYKSSPVTIDGITYESIYYSDLVAIV
jgi:co-chaperonin GroES (HSP10)